MLRFGFSLYFPFYLGCFARSFFIGSSSIRKFLPHHQQLRFWHCRMQIWVQHIIMWGYLARNAPSSIRWLQSFRSAFHSLLWIKFFIRCVLSHHERSNKIKLSPALVQHPNNSTRDYSSKVKERWMLTCQIMFSKAGWFWLIHCNVPGMFFLMFSYSSPHLPNIDLP